MATKKKIPNPASLKITKAEEDFINSAHADNAAKQDPEARKARGRNISMHDDIWESMNAFLAEFPSEGSRSSLISRVVSDYIRKRRAELRNIG